MEIDSLEILKFITFFIMTTGVVYLAYKSKKQSDTKKSNENSAPLKLVKLYSEEGKLLQTYDEVYIQRWDERIYNLYTKKAGEHIIKLDLGVNMLLTSENVKEK